MTDGIVYVSLENEIKSAFSIRLWRNENSLKTKPLKQRIHLPSWGIILPLLSFYCCYLKKLNSAVVTCCLAAVQTRVNTWLMKLTNLNSAGHQSKQLGRLWYRILQNSFRTQHSLFVNPVFIIKNKRDCLYFICIFLYSSRMFYYYKDVRTIWGRSRWQPSTGIW